MTPDQHLTLPAGPGATVSHPAPLFSHPPTQKDVILRLFAVEDGARLARHLVRAVLATWPASCDPDTAVTVMGELFANACAATPGRPVQVRVSWHPDGARLECWDQSPSHPTSPALPSDLLSETGRGMYLIQALSLSYGVTVPDTRGTFNGKSVWALVPTSSSSS